MTERDAKMMLERAVRRLRASVDDNDPDCEFDAKPADDIKRLLAEYDRLRATAAAPAQRPTGADLENRVIEAITEWVGETEPDHALAAAREAIAIVRDSAQGVQEIDAWMRADGSAATVNPMTAGMWKAQGHTILPLYRHPASQVPSTQRQCLECGELIPGHSSFSWCRKCREASTTTPAQPSSTESK